MVNFLFIYVLIQITKIIIFLFLHLFFILIYFQIQNNNANICTGLFLKQSKSRLQKPNMGRELRVGAAGRMEEMGHGEKERLRKLLRQRAKDNEMERDRNKKLDHFLGMDKQGQAWAAIIAEIKRRIETGPRGTVTELARLLQTTRGTVSRWAKGSLKGERMSYDKVCFMLEQLGLDAHVYFGTGGHQPWATPPLGGVPLIGLAACGHDLWTRERMNLTVPRPGDQAYNAELFAVVAMGYSMRPAGVEPGFILYCDPLTRLDEGDTVFVKNTTIR